MKPAFAGGGTGGHLAPAVALLEELRERGDDSGGLILTAGPAAASLERKVPAARVVSIPAGSFSCRRPWTIPSRLLRNRRGYRRSLAALKEYRPDLVVGLGGYVSLPPLLAARRLGIPAVCHEQNRVLGRANRFLARGSVPVIAAFPLESPGIDPGRVVRLGAPVRRAALAPAPEGTREAWGLEPGRFTLLVLGGSRGARPVNRLLEAAAGIWSARGETGEIQVIHCAGTEDSRRLERTYRERGLSGVVFSSLEEIGRAYSLADLAVGRAGGATLSELAAWGLPAILIPYPFATGDHQMANARYFQEAGAARVFPQEEITPELLVREVERIRTGRELRREMSEAARGLHDPESAGKIIDYLEGMLESYDRTG